MMIAGDSDAVDALASSIRRAMVISVLMLLLPVPWNGDVSLKGRLRLCSSAADHVTLWKNYARVLCS